ncbi:hypothetical protein [Candidatus Amarobacter glycogenicus]
MVSLRFTNPAASPLWEAQKAYPSVASTALAKTARAAILSTRG